MVETSVSATAFFMRRLPQFLGMAFVAAGVFAFAPMAMATNPACGDAIRITPGDTLLRVATACDTTVPALLAANPAITQPNRLYVGQLVWMPGRNPAVSVHRPAATPVPTQVPSQWGQGAFSRCGATVQVRPGDTFSGIARRCGVTPAQLRAENPRLRDQNLIFAGMVLRVPSSVDARPHRPATPVAPDVLHVTGTISREGITCAALRGDDGRLYTITGQTAGFQPGDRVQIIGEVAEMSFCQQGTTVNVRSIRHAW